MMLSVDGYVVMWRRLTGWYVSASHGAGGGAETRCKTRGRATVPQWIITMKCETGSDGFASECGCVSFGRQGISQQKYLYSF